MRLRYIARLSGIILLPLLLTHAWAYSVGAASQSTLHTPKHGVARALSGQAVGAVVDFIVNLPTGKILFAVVAPPHGKSQSVILLPWQLAQVDDTGSVFDFAISAHTIRRAPRLSAKRWKQAPTPKWLPAIETYWQTHAAVLPVPASPEITLGKATALIGIPVHSADSTELGTIRELVFDPTDGAIALVVLARATTRYAQSHIEFITLPWEHLYVKPWRNTLIAVAGQRVLTSFNPQHWHFAHSSVHTF